MDQFLAEVSLFIEGTISWFSSKDERRSKSVKDNQRFQGDVKHDFCSPGVDDQVKEPLITPQKCSRVIAIHGEDEHHVPSTKISKELSDSGMCSTQTSFRTDIVEDKTVVFTIPDAGAPKDNGTEGDQHNKSFNGARRVKKTNCSEQVTERVEEVKRSGIWLRDYCSSHKILLVGEGDFSFSVCLAKAFSSAANMVATSLDSLAFLEENYPSAKSHIGYLKKRGCSVRHEVDATKMAENLDVNVFVYDRIIFNFPLAGLFNESKKVQLKRNRNLVRLFFKNARKLIACDGEVHVRHKSSSSYREWNLENLASQAGFKLIEDVEFKLSQYRGYNNKYLFEGNEIFNCYPSRTYKFVLKDEKIRVVGENKSWMIKSVKDDQWFQGDLKYDFSSRGEDHEVKEPLITLQKCSHVIAIQGEDEHHVPSASEQFTKSSQELSDSDKCFTQTSLGMKDIVEDKTLVITIPDAVAPTEGNQHSSTNCAQRPKKTSSSEQVEEVKREDIWIGDYCSSHTILLVGEGDFSFSVCLAKAFGSAANMVATSLDSLAFLEENYPSSKSHIGYLKKRRCNVIHELDATKMAENLDENDFVFDRIIFNFPLAGFFHKSKKVQLKQNRNLVRLFFENAKKLIACDGEVHIRHKSSSSYREWNLESLAGQAGFKLIEDVEFKLSQYRGYNNKYRFEGNENFNCYPSRTYKFVLKDEKIRVVGGNKSWRWFQGNLKYDFSSRGEDDEVKEPLITVQTCSHVIEIQGEDEHHVPGATEQFTKSSPELSDSDKCFTQTSLGTKDIVEDKTLIITIPDAVAPKENGIEVDQHSSTNGAQRQKKTNSSEQVKERVEEVKREGIWIGDYCSSHKILLVGEGDFSFSVCLAKAFGSAANMVATSLDSSTFLEENYPSATSHIGYLKKRGCSVRHEVDATKMAENLVLNDFVYDRVVFNFPLAGFFNESKNVQLKRNRKLVRLFFENAKKLIACGGEVHIRHKSSSSYHEWNLESLASQAGFKLIEDVEFKLSQYRGYNNKYGFGGNENFNCNPSRTYKFVLKDEKIRVVGVVGETKSWVIKSVKDDQVFQGHLKYDCSSRGEDGEVKEPLITLKIGSHVIAFQGEDEHHVPSTTGQLTKSFQELSDSDKCFTQTSLGTKDIVEDKTLVITIPDAGDPKENGTEGDQHSSTNGSQRQKKTNSSDQVKEGKEEVKREDIWIGDYCSSHTILLVGEGDFSFSVCLAKAFGSAANMVATSLDSLAFLEENYPSSKSHIGFLKKRGCNVIHELDATKMAKDLDENDFVFDRIIFNFPLAGFQESKKIQLKRNRNLVRLFFENAKKLIACDGEVHIRHKSSSFYREWNLASLAGQAGFKLIEDVEFKLSQYRGYNNKYGFGGNENFDCNPSRTYKFVLKDENSSFF